MYRGPSDIGLAFGVRNRSSGFGLFGFRQVEAGAGAQALMDTGGDIHGLEFVFRHPTSGEVHTLPTTWPVGGFRSALLEVRFGADGVHHCLANGKSIFSFDAPLSALFGVDAPQTGLYKAPGSLFARFQHLQLAVAG